MTKPLLPDVQIEQVHHWLKDNYAELFAAQEDLIRRATLYDPAYDWRNPKPVNPEDRRLANAIMEEIRLHRDQFKFLDEVSEDDLDETIRAIYIEMSMVRGPIYERDPRLARLSASYLLPTLIKFFAQLVPQDFRSRSNARIQGPNHFNDYASLSFEFNPKRPGRMRAIDCAHGIEVKLTNNSRKNDGLFCIYAFQMNNRSAIFCVIKNILRDGYHEYDFGSILPVLELLRIKELDQIFIFLEKLSSAVALTSYPNFPKTYSSFLTEPSVARIFEQAQDKAYRFLTRSHGGHWNLIYSDSPESTGEIAYKDQGNDLVIADRKPFSPS